MQNNIILPMDIANSSYPYIYYMNWHWYNYNYLLMDLIQLGETPGTLHGWPIIKQLCQIYYIMWIPYSYHMVMAKNNIGLRQSIQDELKSINKRQPAFFANIIHVSRGVVHEWYTPSTPIYVVIHPLAMPFL